MVLNIGINGFGRIGRIAFRASLQYDDLRVTAINDPAIDVEYFNYLLKYDSTHGKFKGQLEIKDNKVFVNGLSIKIYQHKNPSSIPWQNTGVQYVIESSGVFTTQEKASGHLSNGVKRVIVTAPSVDVPMIILGVNDSSLTTDTRIISCASSTLYCLAPIMQVLEQNFGVAEGFVTSIHAMTPSLKPLDSVCVRGKHWRDHRSIHQNIIPAATGVCKALSKVLPQLRDKLSGIAFRVPVVDVSLLDISIRLKTATNLEEILKKIEIAKQTYLKNIINIAKEEVVSTDFVEDSNSCTIDIGSSLQLKPNFYKIICWYENEYSYACRIFDTMHYCKYHLENNEKDHIYKNIIHSTIANSCENYPNEKHKNYSTEKQKLNEDTKNSFTNYSSLTVIPIQIKNIVKDNISILFKSQPKTNKQSSKGSEAKVEKLRDEVTKCVDMTEKLLKDSQRNRLSFKSTVCNLVNRELFNNHKKLNKIDKINSNVKNIQTATDDNEEIKSKSTSNNTNYEDILKKYDVTKLSDKVLKMTKNNKLNLNNINKDASNEISSDLSEPAILKFKNEHFDKKYLEEDKTSDTQMKLNDSQLLTQQTSIHESNFIKKEINTLQSNHIILPERENTYTKYSNNMVILGVQDKTKECTEPEATVEKNKYEGTEFICNTKQDIILDKLDSKSGSDSNNSFEMNNRKSEIISLQDISKSLEDLTKLEQICKIIDISDDLSDKLFSPLNTSSHRNSDRSSLKELCNKIHLNEFYDNVFCSCDDEE